MGKYVAPDVRAKAEAYLAEGYSINETAKRCGLHYNTVAKWKKGRSGNAIPPDAQRALDDFAYFRARYFGRVTTAWQILAANKLVELLETENEEYLVLNCPPGSGKSTLLTDFCLWVLCRDRTTRILYGSRTQAQAEQYTRRIRAALERTDVVRAGHKDVERGLAADALAVLNKDFGVFKPANNDLWRIEKFVVQVGSEQVSDDKEASVAAFGMDSGMLGGRFNLNVWDDLVDAKNLRTAESREYLQGWWDTIAETRVEPGGLVALVGQRLSADDIYRYALDLLGDDTDLVELEDHIGGDPQEERPKKYQHVIFRAHDDEKCAGTILEDGDRRIANPAHKLTAPEWPHGCLLDPRRLSWKKLAPLKANKGELFNVVYQQEDIDPAASLVKQIWVKGGKDSDGIMYPGCLDEHRDLVQLPRTLSGEVHHFISVDPSPTKYWSVQHWAFHRESNTRWLIDLVRQRMDAPDFFDYDTQSGTYHGLLEDWWQRAANKGWRIGHVIVEDNAAQRFMLQSDAIKKWSASRETLLVAHSTHRNKADPEFGVQMLAPLYMRGQIRLPYGTEQARLATMKLTHEVTRWPHSGTEDCVMAQWFFEHRLEQLAVPTGVVYQFKRPSWVRGAA
jgi:hypothetical protein